MSSNMLFACSWCGKPTEWEGNEPPLCVACFDAKVDQDEAERMSVTQKASRARRKQSVAAYSASYYRTRKAATR